MKKPVFYLPLLLVLLVAFSCKNKTDYNSWPQYKGSNENIHYSSLNQVDTANVKQLQVAWMYHTRDADPAHHSQIQCNPIVIDGVLYGTTPKMKLFAIDAVTGKEKWQFNPTKSGFIFTFDRVTGKPVYDVVEKQVPTNTDLIGEKLSPTQPYPTSPGPFMRQLFTEKEINPYLTDSSKQQVLKALAGYRHDHMFNPPSLQGTVFLPGLDGGAEWGGPSYDPETGLLYINANQMAWLIQAIPIQTVAVAHETNLSAGLRLFKSNCMTCHGADRKGSGTFPSLINVSIKYTAASFDTLIQSGRRMMPAFRQLKPAEREALASFILNLKDKQPKAFVNVPDNKDEQFKVPYSITGYNKFLSKEGYPALSPPWGTLNAINLNTGKYVWKQTLGDDPEFPHGKAPSGTENYGASVVTKGGLLFIAATKDGKFRAFNKASGKLLWEISLPAPGYATPSIYEINGKQFIVIACGGGKMNTRSGDSYVAYALPGK